MSRTCTLSSAAALALLVAPCVGLAADKADGPNEIAGLITYAYVDYGSVGDTQETDVRLSYGRYLTDMHQIGVSVGYYKVDLDYISFDGSTLGVFYALHFPTSGTVTPYIGINASYLGGNLGDVFEFQYGASAGIKVYPFPNGGFSIGVAYDKLSAAEDFDDDADGLSVGVGLLLRF